MPAGCLALHGENSMSDDIIATQAWTCGGKDGCASLWHKRNFWAYSDGTYSVDDYADGDHDVCAADDIPTSSEIDKSWRDYSAHVLETGADPLGEFMVMHTSDVRERWQFRFTRSILGVVVVGARRANRLINPRDLPEHVRQYLDMQPGKTVTSCAAGWDEFAELVPGVKPGVWMTRHIDNKKPRGQIAIMRDLKAAARRSLKR
jgi:hypothetical protein